MSRWKAFAIHFSISLLIGATILALLFWVWYPAPYFAASGGKNLTLILLGVDLVLGPLLTLVVFKAGKKSLRFDLSVIALLQVAALAYGLHVIVQARPVFIVAAIDRFNLVAANEIEAADLAKGREPAFRHLSWTGPQLVAARLPEKQDDRLNPLTVFTTGKDIYHYPELYVDYASEVSILLTRAKPLAKLRESHPQHAAVINEWLQTHQRREDDLLWLPVLARNTGMTMLLDSKSGMPLQALLIDSW